jgi:hypothetical protein
MTTDLHLKPNFTSSKIDKNVDLNLNKTRHLIENFNVRKFYELTANEEERDNYEITDDISYTLYIAESRLHECPTLNIKIAGEEIQALIETGCEMSILNENLYKKLRHAGSKCPELPTQHVSRVSVINNKCKMVKNQALLEVHIGSTKLEQVMLLSTQLLTEVILGSDFLINYQAETSFPERTITLRVEAFSLEFTGTEETTANRFCDFRLMSIDSQTQQPSTAVKKGQGYTKNFATGGGDESFQDWRRDTGTCKEDS